MCYNVEIPSKIEIHDFIDQYLDNAIRNDEWDEYFHRLSGFTFSKVPILTSEIPDKIQSFNWGLIPKWCKDEAQAKENANEHLKCEE